MSDPLERLWLPVSQAPIFLRWAPEIVIASCRACVDRLYCFRTLPVGTLTLCASLLAGVGA